MVRFNLNFYPKYNQLSIIDKIFFRTCCYYPPKLRRPRVPDTVINTRKYCEVYGQAFGNDLWQLIEGKKVLDFGCGEGGFILALATKGAGIVFGLDPNFDSNFANHESHKRGYKNIFFINGTPIHLVIILIL